MAPVAGATAPEAGPFTVGDEGLEGDTNTGAFAGLLLPVWPGEEGDAPTTGSLDVSISTIGEETGTLPLAGCSTMTGLDTTVGVFWVTGDGPFTVSLPFCPGDEGIDPTTAELGISAPSV